MASNTLYQVEKDGRRILVDGRTIKAHLADGWKRVDDLAKEETPETKPPRRRRTRAGQASAHNSPDDGAPSASDEAPAEAEG